MMFASGWVAAYLVIALAVGAGVLWPRASRLCDVAFAVSLLSVVFHIVRASLTRHLLPTRLLVGANVVVLAAASLVRDELITHATAALIAAVDDGPVTRAQLAKVDDVEQLVVGVEDDVVVIVVVETGVV